MGSRARHALIIAALAALPAVLTAQRPPAAPARDTVARDTLAPELIFNDIFAGASTLAPRVLLTKHVVYRVEVQPASANLSIRAVRQPSLPPMFLVPLEGGGAPGASQTAAFLVVPPSTQEYRIDVTATGGEPVRLRVWRDPKESARFSRIRAEGFRAPILAVSLRAMYLTSFRDAYSSALDTQFGYFTTPQSALGVKGCLAVVPNGRVLPDRLGGCAIAVTFWRRASGRNFFTVGIEPELVVRRGPTWEVSVSPQLAFGNTTGGAPKTSYVLLGAGARYTVAFARTPTLGFLTEASLVNVRSLPSSLDPRRVSALALSLGAGFILSL
jgi:hypothetical protein